MNLLELMQKYSGITALCIYIPLLILILHIRQLYRNKMAMQEKEKQMEEKQPLNLEDENAVVAALMASIACHEEYKTDVRVISVREVK